MSYYRTCIKIDFRKKGDYSMRFSTFGWYWTMYSLFGFVHLFLMKFALTKPELKILINIIILCLQLLESQLAHSKLCHCKVISDRFKRCLRVLLKIALFSVQVCVLFFGNSTFRQYSLSVFSQFLTLLFKCSTIQVLGSSI